jgi:hypothetical protein
MKIRLPTKYDLIIAMTIFGLIIILGKSIDFNNSLKPANCKEYFKPNLHRINKGVITAKYIDRDNHANNTIELTINDSLKYYYILQSEIELYNFIKIKDSILKTEFGKEIIIRRNGIDSIFKLHITSY